MEVRPSLAVLHGTLERRLESLLAWTPEEGRSGVTLRLDGGLIDPSDGESYNRSGLGITLARAAGAVSLQTGVTLAVGAGWGPRRVYSASLGAGLPSVSLQVRTTWFTDAPADSTPLPGARFGEPARFVDGRYTDAEVQGVRDAGPLGLRLVGGIRFGARPSTGASRWLWAEAVAPLGWRLTLVVSGGARPERRELAQVGGTFAQVSLRLGVGSPASDEPAAEPPRAVPEPEPPVVTRLAAERYLLSLRIPGARCVEIKGDITDWEARPMRRAESRERWEIEIDSPPGVYTMAVRVDGGEWRVPPGSVAVSDRFGGTVGLLTLPPGKEDDDEGNR
jgi:hypothetical protein